MNSPKRAAESPFPPSISPTSTTTNQCANSQNQLLDAKLVPNSISNQSLASTQSELWIPNQNHASTSSHNSLSSIIVNAENGNLRNSPNFLHPSCSSSPQPTSISAGDAGDEYRTYNNNNLAALKNDNCDDDKSLISNKTDANANIDVNLVSQCNEYQTKYLQSSSSISLEKRGSASSHRSHRKSRIIIRKFQKLDQTELSSTPAPDVKIGQRVAYKEYYGNEFGTIRWIGRVPQICPDWTAGVEFDNAIGEGDGSLNGRRYFIAKDCFAKFLPLSEVAFVDQHVGRPEPGTMISVMSAAVRPGQMISIQRVSTVHVQHCFLNAPHQIPGADILAVNTRLHCQCPNCGPCAHVIKPPRTQRLARSKKNATHMCQFSTYTCCGMESQEEAMCSYTGNKASSSLPSAGLPPLGGSWIDGVGYLTNLQAQQSKMMPEEYKMGAAPEDIVDPHFRHRLSRSSSSRRGSGKNQNHRQRTQQVDGHEPPQANEQLPTPSYEFATMDSQQQQQQDHPVSPQPLRKKKNQDYQDQTNGQSDKIVSNNIEYMPNPPSYSPNPDYANFQQFSIANRGKTNNNISTTPYVEPVWCESSQKSTPVPSTKGAKVVYRDSIENRYLFPTDEPIDPILEEDLENLSQARYGPGADSRLVGSKNIFKSLRSLVSCLSAQSNHSEEFERRSENTLKFSEFGDSRGTSKAMPERLASDLKPTDDGFLVQSNQSNSSAIFMNNKDNARSKELEAEATATYGRPIKTGNNNWHQNGNENIIKSKLDTSSNDHACIVRQISSSSDCGFSSASQNSINFQSYQTYSPISISADEKRKRDEIYNNFLAKLMHSTSVSENELIRLRRVLFEPSLAHCCVHNASIVNRMSIGAFDSIEAERMFADRSQHYGFNHDCFCSKQANANNYLYSNNKESNAEVMDEKRKLRSEEEPHQRTTTSCGSSGRDKSTRSLIDTASESATLSSYDSFNGTAAIGGGGDAGDDQSMQSNQEARITRSRCEDRSPNPLSKAFELTLKLSINSEKNSDQQESSTSSKSTSDAVKLDTLEETTKGSLINPTFNINIISGRKDDPIESAEVKVQQKAEESDLNEQETQDKNLTLIGS